MVQLAFKIVGEWSTDDKDVTAGAVVAAGAAAGTNVKNPADGSVGTVEAVAEYLGDALKDLLDKRKDCLDDDADREHDLITCSATVEYLLLDTFDGKWEELDELVELRIDEMEAAGRDDQAIAQARAHLESARLNPATHGAFVRLCEAYRSLTGAPSAASESNGPRRPGGR